MRPVELSWEGFWEPELCEVCDPGCTVLVLLSVVRCPLVSWRVRSVSGPVSLGCVMGGSLW